MSKINILYFGSSEFGSTSMHRANALMRLGYSVKILDPYKAIKLNKNIIYRNFHFKTGYRYTQNFIKEWLLNQLFNISDFNIAWVDGGELFGCQALEILNGKNLKTILYNHDDPTGYRDKRRFDTLQTAIPFYTLCVVVRDENISEFKRYGAKSVVRIYRGYDEIMHAPIMESEVVPPHFKSDVAFIGTWIRGENRDKFILELCNQGLSVSIWGDRWSKSPYWKKIKHCYRGKNLTGKHYVFAIQGAKLCLGFLSKGNRDLHTTRSLEIPYAGGLLCAERTTEHMTLYKDGIEAVFWDNSEECAQKCIMLLNDATMRHSIQSAGFRKVRSLGLGNEDNCKLILNKITELQ